MNNEINIQNIDINDINLSSVYFINKKDSTLVELKYFGSNITIYRPVGGEETSMPNSLFIDWYSMVGVGSDIQREHLKKAKI